jgi:hypothetical protein
MPSRPSRHACRNTTSYGSAMLVQLQAELGAAQELGEALRCSIGSRDQIEGIEEEVPVVSPLPQLMEDRQPLLVTADSLAVDQA